MSTTIATEFRPVGPSGRIMNVVKLNLTNPWNTIILPWIILGLIFALNLVMWWVIASSVPSSDRADTEQGLQFSGATTWVFIYMMIIAIQAVNLTFPFALGYGVTRRDFWLGSAVTFVILAALYAVGLTALSVIEDATNGWGFGARLFSSYIFGEGAAQNLFIFFVAFLFFFFFGAMIGAVYVRWRATGVSLFFVAFAIVVVAAVAGFTLTRNWQIVGNFFVGAGLVGSFALSLVPTAIAGVAGFVILSKATPKNA